MISLDHIMNAPHQITIGFYRTLARIPEPYWLDVLIRPVSPDFETHNFIIVFLLRSLAFYAWWFVFTFLFFFTVWVLAMIALTSFWFWLEYVGPQQWAIDYVYGKPPPYALARLLAPVPASAPAPPLPHTPAPAPAHIVTAIEHCPDCPCLQGGKNRRRARNEEDIAKRELVFKEEGQEYAQVQKMLGNGRIEAKCQDGETRLAQIRGQLRKKVWINVGDIILLSLRDFQDDRADVIHRYTPDEARNLKTYGELKNDFTIHEGGGGGDEEEVDDDGVEFGDADVDDL